MADELAIQIAMRLQNGSLNINHNESISVDQTNARGGVPGTVTVGTSEEVISTGDITTLGYAFIINLDSTNYVRFGPESGGAMVPFLRLKPGEFDILRLEPGITIRGQANTADVDCFISILDD